MKKTSENTTETAIEYEPLLITVIIRILGFPFFLGLAIVYSAILLVKYIFCYVRYGGEAISYTRKNQRRMIEDIYQELVNMNQNRSSL